MRESYMRTLRTTVRLRAVDAQELTKKGRIKIGWVYSRVRLKTRPLKCFRCLGYGHIRYSCRGPDRLATCHLCGNEGHQAINCGNEPRCVACQDMDKPADHYPGSGKCSACRLVAPRKNASNNTGEGVTARSGSP